MGRLKRALLWLFGQRFYVVEYAPDDICYYLTTAPHERSASGGADAFGGCKETGVFHSRVGADAFRCYVDRKFSNEWPVIPTEVVRVPQDDSRVIRYKQLRSVRWD